MGRTFIRTACLVLSIAFLALAAPAWAQPIAVGIKGGVPLNDALNTPLQPSAALQYTENTHRWVLGPSVELNLPAGFGVELDALYRSYDYQLVATTIGQSPGQWEFPLLAKYRIFPGPIRPYVEGGISFARLTNVSDLIALKNRSSSGIVLGGGVEFHIAVVKITAEIRYNNWTSQFFNIPALQSNQNQATALLGFSFK